MGPPLVLIFELHFSNHLKIQKKYKNHGFRQFLTTFGGPGWVAQIGKMGWFFASFGACGGEAKIGIRPPQAKSGEPGCPGVGGAPGKVNPFRLKLTGWKLRFFLARRQKYIAELQMHRLLHCIFSVFVCVPICIMTKNKCDDYLERVFWGWWGSVCNRLPSEEEKARWFVFCVAENKPELYDIYYFIVQFQLLTDLQFHSTIFSLRIPYVI